MRELFQAEHDVVMRLAEAWNAFLALPIEHGDDITEFRHGVHRLQEKVLCRPVRARLMTVSETGVDEREHKENSSFVPVPKRGTFVPASDLADPSPANAATPDAWLVIGAQARKAFADEAEAITYAGHWGKVIPLAKQSPASQAADYDIQVRGADQAAVMEIERGIGERDRAAIATPSPSARSGVQFLPTEDGEFNGNGPDMAAVEAEIARVVQSVNEWDDRTSPDEYPEHLLITSEELTLILRNFATTLEGSADGN